VTARPVRIAPQQPHEWSDATRAKLAGVVPTGGSTRPVHLPGVIAHHPTLLAPYLVWAKAIALHGVLAPRDNALLALRTAVLARSAFEWGVHADSAPARAGLEPAEIDAIGVGPTDPSWSSRDRALLQAADDLHDNAGVRDATWAELARDHDDAALLEIVFVVGHYTMLSMVANSSGVAPEPHWRALPDAR
jgi:4-carboxymuconolactone decarboxylase